MVNHCVIVRRLCVFGLVVAVFLPFPPLVLRDCVRVVRRGFTQRHTAVLMLKRAKKMKSKKQQKKKKGESLDCIYVCCAQPIG